MKKTLCLVLTFVLLLGLCACGGETAKNYEGLQVGFGRESILPDQLGVQIAGGDAKARIADGVRDEIAATCIAIKEGGETILLYTIDFITVDKHVYTAQADIAAATGIDPRNIILNTTHTHSSVSIRSDWTGADAYREKYRAATVDAALQSCSALLQIEQLRCQRFLKTDLLAVFRTGKPVAGGEASHRAAQPGGLLIGQASQLLPECHDGVFRCFFHG